MNRPQVCVCCGRQSPVVSLRTMLPRPSTLVCLAALCALSSAAEVAERVTATLDGRLSTELPVDSVRVVLNGGARSAIPRQDGSFKLHAVPPGTYLLEVMDTQSVWPTVRRTCLAPHTRTRSLHSLGAALLAHAASLSAASLSAARRCSWT